LEEDEMTTLHSLYVYNKIKLGRRKYMRTHTFYQADPEAPGLRVYFTSGFMTVINDEAIDGRHIVLIERFMTDYSKMYGNVHCSRKELVKVMIMLLYVYLKADLYDRIYWKIRDFKKILR
jgi:hypothetical protein